MTRAAAFAGAAVAAYPVFVFLTAGVVPASIALVVAVQLIVAALRVDAGLLMLTAVAPFGDWLAAAAGVPAVRLSEAVTLAFISGWCIAIGSRRLRGVVPGAAALCAFASIVLGSVVWLMLRFHAAAPGFEQQVASQSLRSYLWMPPNTASIAANLLEGVALLAAAATVCRRLPATTSRVAATLCSAGALAAGLAVLLVFRIAPASVIAHHDAIGLARFSAIVWDVNAAGSFFALLLPIGFGAASAGGQHRRWWYAATVLLAGGLALAGSRAAWLAIATTVAIAAGSQLGSQRQRRIAPVAAAAAVIVVALASSIVGSAAAFDTRRGFTRSSLALIAAEPAFGVGIGEYYRLSLITLPPWLSMIYGRENAHDYYLQIAAELGIVGVLGFLWVLAAALGPAVRQWRRARPDPLITSLMAGAGAFLLTCVTGHPLLVFQVAVPFWIVLGTIAAVETATPASRTPREWAAAAMFVLIAAAGTTRSTAISLRPPRTEGIGPVVRAADGALVRRSAAFASVFAPSGATGVSITLRRGHEWLQRSVIVNLQLPGWPNRVEDAPPEWTTVRVLLPPDEPLMPFKRVNLQVLDVTADPRHPAPAEIEISEIRVDGPPSQVQ